MALGGEMKAVDLAREFGIEDSTSRRWAQGHGEMGGSAFPGNGSSKVDGDTGLRSPAKGRDGIIISEKRALAVMRKPVNGRGRKTREEMKRDALKPSSSTAAGGGCAHQSATTPPMRPRARCCPR